MYSKTILHKHCNACLMKATLSPLGVKYDWSLYLGNNHIWKVNRQTTSICAFKVSHLKRTPKPSLDLLIRTGSPRPSQEVATSGACGLNRAWAKGAQGAASGADALDHAWPGTGTQLGQVGSCLTWQQFTTKPNQFMCLSTDHLSHLSGPGPHTTQEYSSTAMFTPVHTEWQNTPSEARLHVVILLEMLQTMLVQRNDAIIASRFQCRPLIGILRIVSSELKDYFTATRGHSKSRILKTTAFNTVPNCSHGC